MKQDLAGEQIGRLTNEIAKLELAVRLAVDLGQAQNEAIAAMERRIASLEAQNSVLVERSVNQGVALDLRQAELQEHERKGLAASAVAAFVLIVVAIVVASSLGVN